MKKRINLLLVFILSGSLFSGPLNTMGLALSSINKAGTALSQTGQRFVQMLERVKPRQLEQEKYRQEQRYTIDNSINTENIYQPAHITYAQQALNQQAQKQFNLEDNQIIPTDREIREIREQIKSIQSAQSVFAQQETRVELETDPAEAQLAITPARTSLAIRPIEAFQSEETFNVQEDLEQIEPELIDEESIDNAEQVEQEELEIVEELANGTEQIQPLQIEELEQLAPIQEKETKLINSEETFNIAEQTFNVNAEQIRPILTLQPKQNNNTITKYPLVFLAATLAAIKAGSIVFNHLPKAFQGALREYNPGYLQRLLEDINVNAEIDDTNNNEIENIEKSEEHTSVETFNVETILNTGGRKTITPSTGQEIEQPSYYTEQPKETLNTEKPETQPRYVQNSEETFNVGDEDFIGYDLGETPEESIQMETPEQEKELADNAEQAESTPKIKQLPEQTEDPKDILEIIYEQPELAQSVQSQLVQPKLVQSKLAQPKLEQPKQTNNKEKEPNNTKSNRAIYFFILLALTLGTGLLPLGLRK